MSGARTEQVVTRVISAGDDDTDRCEACGVAVEIFAFPTRPKGATPLKFFGPCNCVGWREQDRPTDWASVRALIRDAHE